MLQVQSLHFVESAHHENMETEHRKRKRRIKMMSQCRTTYSRNYLNLTFFLSISIFLICLLTDEASAKECSINIGELIA